MMLATLALALALAAPPQQDLGARAAALLGEYHRETSRDRRIDLLREIASLTGPGVADAEVARALAEGLSDQSFEVRTTALALLRDEGSAERRAALLAASASLPDELTRLRDEARANAGTLVEAMGAAGDELTIDLFTSTANAAVSSQRWKAAGLYAGELSAAVAALRDPASAERLAKLLDALGTDPGSERCLEGLCDIGTRAALEAAIGWLDVRRASLERCAEQKKTLKKLRPKHGSPRGVGEKEWIERQKTLIRGWQDQNEADAKRVDALGETLSDRLDEIARARSLPKPPRSPDDPERWARWWEENASSVPEEPEG